jgi:hypothetical protein
MPPEPLFVGGETIAIRELAYGLISPRWTRTEMPCLTCSCASLLVAVIRLVDRIGAQKPNRQNR